MKAMRDVWGETLVALGKANPNVVVLDADLANSTKADKFAKAHPDRFLQMGIAEQNCVGVAVGLATVGYVPWLSSFAIFFTHRAVDSIRMLVAQTHANVKIGGAYAGVLTGLTGKTHQDVEDLAIMRAMPNITVLAPADEVEEVLNSHMASRQYFLGDTFSALDILLGGGLHFLIMAKMIKETPVLKAYSARITDRPAYRKMMETDKR